MPMCRTCSAPVMWATTTTGKAIPLNPEPRPGGNIDLRDGVAHVVKPDGQARYTSHFSDCPQANGHRKARTR
jgi:hypothetical protein